MAASLIWRGVSFCIFINFVIVVIIGLVGLIGFMSQVSDFRFQVPVPFLVAGVVVYWSFSYKSI